MRTTALNFTIKIPTFLYRFRYRNVASWLKWKLNPYRCPTCATELPFDSFNIWGKAKHRELGIHSGDNICPACVLKRVDRTVAAPGFDELQTSKAYNVRSECSCCGEKKTAYKFLLFSTEYGDDLKFCTNSWNGNHVCLDCIRTALETGIIRSSMLGMYNGELVYLNRHGLPVVNGEVRFPSN